MKAHEIVIALFMVLILVSVGLLIFGCRSHTTIVRINRNCEPVPVELWWCECERIWETGR